MNNCEKFNKKETRKQLLLSVRAANFLTIFTFS